MTDEYIWRMAYSISTASLFQALYTSTFARGLPVWLVPDIVAQSRVRNIERGISGMLVFDGAQFCQYLEGPQAVVSGLIAHIRTDARHTDFTVLHSGRIAQRRFGSFAMGLATLGDDEEFLERVTRLRGQTAMRSFFDGIAELDRTEDSSRSTTHRRSRRNAEKEKLKDGWSETSPPSAAPGLWM